MYIGIAMEERRGWSAPGDTLEEATLGVTYKQ